MSKERGPAVAAHPQLQRRPGRGDPEEPDPADRQQRLGEHRAAPAGLLRGARHPGDEPRATEAGARARPPPHQAGHRAREAGPRGPRDPAPRLHQDAGLRRRREHAERHRQATARKLCLPFISILFRSNFEAIVLSENIVDLYRVDIFHLAALEEGNLLVYLSINVKHSRVL